MKSIILLMVITFCLNFVPVQAWELGKATSEELPYEIQKLPNESTYRLNLKLADLIGHKCEFRSYGGNFVELVIGVDNVGEANADPFNVFVRAELLDEQGNTLPFSTQDFMTRFYYLGAHGRDWDYFGDIQVFDREVDYHIRVTVVIDDPNEFQWGGEVWESNETNNVMICEYTLYAL